MEALLKIIVRAQLLHMEGNRNSKKWGLNYLPLILIGKIASYIMVFCNLD